MSSPLLRHFKVLQGRVQAYLEPTPSYTNLMGAEAPKGTPEEMSEFIGDVIYLCDGPQQREAQAHAEFDYLTESARTVSDKFFGVTGRKRLVMQKLASFVEAGEALDRYKKLFFYGEDHAKKRFADPIDSDGNGGDIIEALMRSAEGISQDDAEQLLHAVLGIATEGGEMVEALLNAVAGGRQLDPVNVSEEAGDLLWYLAMLFRVLHIDFDTAMRQNIKKLLDRYPEKFTSELANERDLDSERKVLEGVVFNPPKKQTSPAMSTLAASVLNRTKPGAPMPDISQLIADARSLAASVLSQDETPGQEDTPKRRFFGQDKN